MSTKNWRSFSSGSSLARVLSRIYSRSVFRTDDVPEPTPFYSILGIDVEKEAGLNPSRVHVISGASKDFSINGQSLPHSLAYCCIL